VKIGVIVDGQAESQALSHLFNNIVISGSQIINPLYADMQPKASPEQIARAAYSRICILQAKCVDKIIVLIDNENRADCHINFSNSIKVAVKNLFNIDVYVIVKYKCFENWLISDPNGLSKLKSRLSITNSFINTVSPNKADAVLNPVVLLNSVCNKLDYHKRIDAIAFTKNIDPDKMALNSRSFRRFLREVGYMKYSRQSKRP